MSHPDNPTNLEAAREAFEAALFTAKHGDKRNPPYNHLCWVSVRELMGQASDYLEAHAKERHGPSETDNWIGPFTDKPVIKSP